MRPSHAASLHWMDRRRIGQRPNRGHHADHISDPKDRRRMSFLSASTSEPRPTARAFSHTLPGHTRTTSSNERGSPYGTRNHMPGREYATPPWTANRARPAPPTRHADQHSQCQQTNAHHCPHVAAAVCRAHQHRLTLNPARPFNHIETSDLHLDRPRLGSCDGAANISGGPGATFPGVQ